MGTILQERVAQQYPERVSIREREWKKKASWSNNNNNNRPNVASNKMGRRQSQRKSVQPQISVPSQENHNEKKLQQRRKQKPNTPSTKRLTPQHRSQGASESKSHRPSPTEDRMETKVQPTSQQRCSHREHKLSSFRGSRHSAASSSSSSCHRLEESSPDLQETPPEGGGGVEDDSDTDLSESERLPVSPSRRVPPQLHLRPEVIEAEGGSSQRPRGRVVHGGFDFPDFLPPPFNSWSLGQLAVFYNTEGRGAPRPRPVGPLERYLDRLLQLEWRQIQSVQEEGGKTAAAADVTPGCHVSPAAASTSRLSSPKCILQCQRSFPLTFLSSLASHSALLSGCACTLCRIRYSTCNTSCCRSSTRQSRLSPTLEHGGAPSLPKRSYSESRVHSSDRSSALRPPRLGSPVRTNSHLRRMQASGNIRTPATGANMKPLSTTRESGVGEVLDYRTGGFTRRRRSGSEQRRGGERQRGASEKRRSGSECRRERRRGGAELDEIKPDAVAAIMDNLPASKNAPINRHKQVEFVTQQQVEYCN